MSPSFRSGFGPVEREIIHQIALEEMMTDKEIEDIVRSQFEMALNAIESADAVEDKLYNISLIKFGKFYYRKAYAERIKQIRLGKIARRNESSNS
jgi:nucleoid DNA-binding protein